MTDIVGPFDTSTWSQTEWGRHMLPAMPSGVIASPAAVYSSGGLALLTSGLNWGIDQGRANVGAFGFYRTGTQAADQAITANTNSTLYRRDRIVLRRSLATKTVVPTRIQGTAASTPVAPPITQTDTVWDLPMFSFLVPPASGTILSGFMDERRWLDPIGTSGARGVQGYGVDSTQVSTTSSSGTRPSSPINITVHLSPGRIYEARHGARCWSDVGGTVAALSSRISVAGATPSASDPMVCGSTAVIERGDPNLYRYPLNASDLFTVSAEGDYVISYWIARITGTGTVNLFQSATGRYTQHIIDVGPTATTGPAGMDNIVQAI